MSVEGADHTTSIFIWSDRVSQVEEAHKGHKAMTLPETIQEMINKKEEPDQLTGV